MTNGRRSKRGKRSANSNAPHAGADQPRAPAGRRRLTVDARAAHSLAQLRQRFAQTCRVLQLPHRGPVIVACSGGADSAAALALLRDTAPQLHIIACYVNHKLRPAAAIRRDIAALRQQARFARAAVDVRSVAPAVRGGSVEENARIARYAILQKVAQEHEAAHVVTGHQADDVAETVLLALSRGSGLDGIAAMPAKRQLGESVVLVRPLLFVSRSALRALVVDTLGLPVSEDETNQDFSLRRNAVRGMLGALERLLPGSQRNIARAAIILRGDRALLERVSAQAWQRSKLQPDGRALSTRALRALPLPLLRRVIRQGVKMLLGSTRNFSMQHCDAIARAVKAGRGGSYHAGPARVRISAGSLQIEDATSPNAKNAAAAWTSALPVRLGDGGQIVTPLGTLTLKQIKRNGKTQPHDARERGLLRLDLTALRDAQLAVRLPRPGDKCIPSGRRSATSLARFLAKAGVPKECRATTPLLCAENRIAAALALRVMEPFLPKAGSPVLEVRWQPYDNCR